MTNRYNGKADRFDKRHGKLRRQLDAGTRKNESTVRSCGHLHTDRGWVRIIASGTHLHNGKPFGV